MTDDERAALVEKIARQMCKTADDEWRLGEHFWTDEARRVLSIVEPAIRADEREKAEAEVERLRAAVQKAQRPEGETIDGVVLWIKEDADRLATVRAALATEDRT